MYVYKSTEGNNLWTVGFYDPGANWQPESDHHDKEEAAARVHFLNGGDPIEFAAPIPPTEPKPEPKKKKGKR